MKKEQCLKNFTLEELQNYIKREEFKLHPVNIKIFLQAVNDYKKNKYSRYIMYRTMGDYNYRKDIIEKYGVEAYNIAKEFCDVDECILYYLLPYLVHSEVGMSKKTLQLKQAKTLLPTAGIKTLVSIADYINQYGVDDILLYTVKLSQRPNHPKPYVKSSEHCNTDYSVGYIGRIPFLIKKYGFDFFNKITSIFPNTSYDHFPDIVPTIEKFGFDIITQIKNLFEHEEDCNLVFILKYFDIGKSSPRSSRIISMNDLIETKKLFPNDNLYNAYWIITAIKEREYSLEQIKQAKIIFPNAEGYDIVHCTYAIEEYGITNIDKAREILQDNDCKIITSCAHAILEYGYNFVQSVIREFPNENFKDESLSIYDICNGIKSNII
jgi:hypothetical protein